MNQLHDPDLQELIWHMHACHACAEPTSCLNVRDMQHLHNMMLACRALYAGCI